MKTLATINSELLSVSELLETKQAIVNPNAKTKKEIKVLTAKVEQLTKDSLAQEALEIPADSINADMLNQLTALGITEKIKSINNKKSIFKAEYANKKDRSTCRLKFFKAVGLYLLNIAHNKVDLASNELNNIREITKKYYIAEDSFLNASDYFTENMDENKRNAIKMFIDFMKAEAPKAEAELISE